MNHLFSSAISDDLSYSYEGNRLSSVNSATYSYDANGNITSDGRRGLTIEYNLLNLPSEVTGTVNGTTMTANYEYLPDGTKLSTADNSGSGFAYLGSRQNMRNILDGTCLKQVTSFK